METNPLLDDLEAAHHQHLLEAGNLGKKPRFTEWSDKKPWTSGGYLARVSRYTCKGCGTRNQSLLGIFVVETRGTERRETALDLRNFQMQGGLFTAFLDLPNQAICPACL
jgi:hypothetical protein